MRLKINFYSGRFLTLQPDFASDPVYHVVLESAAGSQEALSSKDEQYISDVVQALNDAIVSRA